MFHNAPPDPDAKTVALAYRKSMHARRKKLKKLKDSLPEPDITPQYVRKPCGFCFYLFPADSFKTSVTIQTMGTLMHKLGVAGQDRFDQRIEAGAVSKYYRIEVCAFCSQFFDPDAPNGLARSNPPEHESAGYQQFFDDRYPDRYSHGINEGSPHRHESTVIRTPIAHAATAT